MIVELISSVPAPMWVAGAVALSVGWGIRGNFGHEPGAALPGALAAMAVVLTSGRPDWFERVHWFALFGAFGWSFGGSISYMQVVGYTHSGHRPTQLYGYANLFVIGFLWAALGGAATTLPAVLSSEELSRFLVPILAVVVAWQIKEVLVDAFVRVDPARRHESPLYWYDSDWLDVLVALLAAGTVVLVRGGLDVATGLILSLGVGWYAAFLPLVNLFRLRMTPPRGDNWAGCVGMVVAMGVYAKTRGWTPVLFALVAVGTLGGVGYALAQLLKLVGIRSGRQTNWHSVLEQLQGAFHGLALAFGMGVLSQRLPPAPQGGVLPYWQSATGVGLVLLGLTYINYRKATTTWVQQVASLPERFYRLPVAGFLLPSRGWIGWFELVYLALTVVYLLGALWNADAPLVLLPATAAGRGMLLMLVFLWWCVVFNFERALTGFAPARIVTEWVIAINAAFLSGWVIWGHRVVSAKAFRGNGLDERHAWTVLGLGLLLELIALGVEFGGTRLLFGSQHAPGAGLHIRFGPNRTAWSHRPRPGERHP
ncbi:MAG: hypothetical protein KatS3mg115_2217 [Candidatus Poribacteria bacterium]|nr:MAG: hypothetical protein KatS3mg115_2217 [Candidatus Poribacteria bacterium]